MLSSDEIAELAAALCATAETLDQTLSASAAELMAEDLAEYPMEITAGALRACRKELTGKLTLAAILSQMHAADGRPARDEAWSIALAGTDEFDTVVLTEEIAQAMAVARPILDEGDKIGARMAFMSAYDRLVTAARQEKKPVAWSVSLGFDAERRVTAVEQAVRLQRLPQLEADKVLLSLEAPTADGRAIAGLLTGKTATCVSDKHRQQIERVRRAMQVTSERRRRNRARQAAAERAKFETQRQAALDALQAAGAEVSP